MTVREISEADWRAEGAALFGPEDSWAFVCPACKHVATVRQWLDAGATPGEIGFSCIGRRTGGRSAFYDRGAGPCDYAGGGLIGLNPVRVITTDGTVQQMMEWATP